MNEPDSKCPNCGKEREHVCDQTAAIRHSKSGGPRVMPKHATATVTIADAKPVQEALRTLAGEVELLRDHLQVLAVHTKGYGGYVCMVCGATADPAEDVKHKPDCLAFPQKKQEEV